VLLRDEILDKKSKSIKESIAIVLDKMSSLEGQAKETEEKLYKILTDTLASLRKEFEDKVALLRSDLLELQRQE